MIHILIITDTINWILYFHPFMIAIIILHSRDGIDVIEIFPSESAAFSRLPPPATQKK